MTRMGIFTLATALGLMLSNFASATALRFELTGRYSGTWMLDSHPHVDVSLDELLFRIDNVPGTFSFSASPVDLVFFNRVFNAGGIAIEPVTFGNFFVTDGDQVYTGPESDPTFHPGHYNLNDTAFVYSLDVTAVPEPTTWAMMIGGFAGLGAAVRRKVGGHCQTKRTG